MGHLAIETTGHGGGFAAGDIVFWHAILPADVASRLDVLPARGLDTSEARRRLQLVGHNRLAEKPPPSQLLAFLAQFRSLIILVLIGAAVVAALAGAPKDAVVIAIVVLVNGTMGFVQERRAERSLLALKGMLAEHSRVRRDGHKVQIPASEVVPGDVLLLEAGDRVAADGRVWLAHNAELDEAALTGESHPVPKAAADVLAADAPLADRHNVVFANTVVTRGRLEILVFATGMKTEMGRVAKLLDDAALRERVLRTAVFARVVPEHKTRIVAALRAAGQVVAMTGDGVNDAPALKSADIGIAMGKSGTEVSKEAASMVLTDDNFATIVHAVQEGRTIYSNIVHFVRFQLATNIGAILTVTVAPLLGLTSPFHAIHILWVNIITDGPPALALGVDRPRPGLMEEAPRGRGEPILPLARLWQLGFAGTVMAMGTLWVLHHEMAAGDVDRARTLCFTTFVLFQVFNAFNARVEKTTVFTRYAFANRQLWLALTVVVLLQMVAVMWPPARDVMHTAALSAGDWAMAVGVASLVLWAEELRKLLRRALRRRRAGAQS